MALYPEDEPTSSAVRPKTKVPTYNIRVRRDTHQRLLGIKGIIYSRTGKIPSLDDVIQEMVYIEPNN